jgi:hypothetical protein
LIDHFWRASAEGKGRGYASSCDGTYARGVRKADLSQEETDAHTGRRFDRCGYQLDEPLAHAGQCEEDEDKPFEEDCRQSCAV